MLISSRKVAEGELSIRDGSRKAPREIVAAIVGRLCKRRRGDLKEKGNALALYAGL